MAGRRMVNIRIIDSDNFLELPLSTQALYFHLLLRADDDGFINNPKRIQRMIGGSEDDFKLLIAKQYILTFSSGVIVIKHWRMHNCIKKDRYHETDCINEKNMLYLNENKTYTFEKPQCIQSGDNSEPEWNPSLGKVSLGKSSINNNILPEQAGQQKQEQQKLENDNKDFEQLYQGAREYHINNTKKRKTKRGMPKFLNGWINRSYVQFVQEPKARANAPKPQIQHNFTQRDYDFDDLEQQLLRKQQEGM